MLPHERAVKVSSQKRAPIPADIQQELRSARHYCALILGHELAAQAAETIDAAQLAIAKEAFQRGHAACLNATRTAKNYLIAAANASGQREWINMRLADPIYRCHADPGGSVFHDNALVLSKTASFKLTTGGRWVACYRTQNW
jgi:hypothetical protein